MLIDFTVENYRSFAEAQTLSLIANNDMSHPENIFSNEQYRLLKSAAIYGPNASGKSNLLKALKFMNKFIGTSATKLNLGDPIPGLDSFRLDKTYRSKPSSFEIHLLINNKHYEYGFSATAERIHNEWLNVKKTGGKGSKISKPLLRKFSPETEKTEWILRGELKEQASDVPDKTRDNCLFLSRSAEMNVEFVSELFLWFRQHMWYFDLSKTPRSLMENTSHLIQRDPNYREQIGNILHDADLGIDYISTKSESIDESFNDLLKTFSDDPDQLAFRDFTVSMRNFLNYMKSRKETNKDNIIDNNQRILIQTIHKLPESGEIIEFPFYDESNGTQRFFSVIGPILEALKEGNLLIIDELECSMHPLLTQKLLELFQSPEANPKGAQLVFATHDSNLMLPRIFRRDQIWLTEKNSKGATELFSLSDIESPPRKEEAFEKNYLSGRYGGVPNFGPSFEDFDIK